MSGKLFVVGTGPGRPDMMTERAREVLSTVDYVVGYRTYVELVKDVISGEILAYGMREEIDRAMDAVKLAMKGKNVAVVSGGDPGVYGMAGLVLGLLAEEDADVEIEVIPGVTAACAAGALLGAPLMLDFAVVSLSDHLVPLDEIMRKIEVALEADYVLVVYNPSSSERRSNLKAFLRVLERKVEPERPVGVVWNAYRDGQRLEITDVRGLKELADDIDMRSTIIVGCSRTRVVEAAGRKWMVTERGYRRTGRNSRE